jgi:hypothetical protein
MQLSERNFKEKEILVTGPRWAPDTKTDWPTDCQLQINFNFNYWVLLYKRVFFYSEKLPFCIVEYVHYPIATTVQPQWTPWSYFSSFKVITTTSRQQCLLHLNLLRTIGSKSLIKVAAPRKTFSDIHGLCTQYTSAFGHCTYIVVHMICIWYILFWFTRS